MHLISAFIVNIILRNIGRNGIRHKSLRSMCRKKSDKWKAVHHRVVLQWQQVVSRQSKYSYRNLIRNQEALWWVIHKQRWQTWFFRREDLVEEGKTGRIEYDETIGRSYRNVWEYMWICREKSRSATFMGSKLECRDTRYIKNENISLGCGKNIVCHEADETGQKTRSSLFYNASST